METSKKAIIINANTGTGWYPTGSQRLQRSLVQHGSHADLRIWNEWPNDNYDKSCPYNIKAAAFEEAIKQGYTHILWLDCSVWAIANPMPVWDIINGEGAYFWSSGANAAQTCSDKCLDYFGITRDEAEKITDCSTSMFGFNLENPIAKLMLYKFIQAAKDGIFAGSREHDNQSRDPRFKFHRQDQSAMTCIIRKHGGKIYQPGEYSSYYVPNPPESVVFLMAGL